LRDSEQHIWNFEGNRIPYWCFYVTYIYSSFLFFYA